MFKPFSHIDQLNFEVLVNRIFISVVFVVAVYSDVETFFYVFFYYLFVIVSSTINSYVKYDSFCFDFTIKNIGYILYKSFFFTYETDFFNTIKNTSNQKVFYWDSMSNEKETYFDKFTFKNFFYFIINFIVVSFIFQDSIITMFFYQKKSESFYKLSYFYYNYFDLTYYQIQAIFFLYFSFITILFSCFFFNNKDNNFSCSKKDLTIYFYFFFIIIIFCFMICSINFISIYIGTEFFSIIMYILIGVYNTDNKVSSQRNAELALRYLSISFLGSITFLVGVSFSFLNFGTLTFTYYPLVYPFIRTEFAFFIQTSTKISIIFIIIGFCIKLGIAPFHSWINGVYDSFSNKIFYFSIVYPKFVFFFIIFNIFIVSSAPSVYSINFENFFYIIGLINLFIGTVSASRQTNIKRFLMYSSIANSGYIFISLSSDSIFGFSTLNYIFFYFFSINFFFIVYYNLFNKAEYSKNYTWNFTVFSQIKNFFDKFAMTIVLLNFSGIPPFTMFFGKLIIINNFIYNDYIISAIIMVFFSVISAYYSIRPIMYIWFYNSNKNTLKINSKNTLIFNQNYKIIVSNSNNIISTSSNNLFINLLHSMNYIVIKAAICISLLSFFVVYETMIFYSFCWELKHIEFYELVQVTSLPVDIEIQNIYKMPLFFYEMLTHTGSNKFNNMCKEIIEKTYIVFPIYDIFNYNVSFGVICYMVQVFFFFYTSNIFSFFKKPTVSKNNFMNNNKIINSTINEKKENFGFFDFVYYIVVNHFNFINPITLIRIFFIKNNEIIYIKSPKKLKKNKFTTF